MNSLLNGLNQEQKQIVNHDQGPLLIVAGAGTGKTTVITKRIIHLINQKKAKPEEILALTFTDKATEEMEERVDALLSTYNKKHSCGYTNLWISTFHSFCEKILRDNGLDIGLSTDFKILDTAFAWILIKQNLEKFKLNYYKPLGYQTKFIQAMLNHFSRCKDQCIYPEDYLKYADNLKTNFVEISSDNQEIERIKEIATAYHIYQKLLLENNSLDFGDLINYCLKLFQKRPFILDKLRKKFKYILVDEFQDTNWAQYELVKLLAYPNNNLIVCADDDQSIYRWRGTSFNNMLQFRKDYPDTKEIFLIKNYRSFQNILNLSYKFIQANNPNRLEYISKINKKLKAVKKGKGTIEHLHFKDSYEEAIGVVNKIHQIIRENKKASKNLSSETSLNDFVILVRANNYANVFIKALEKYNLPYQFLASRGLYSKPIILDIISFFKLLDNYHENSSLYRVLNLPLFNIPTKDITEIIQYAERKTKSLYEVINKISLGPSTIINISPLSLQKINFILDLIRKQTELTRTKNVSEILVSFLKDSGYLKYLSDKEDWQNLDLINQFHQKIKNFEEMNEKTSLKESSLKNFMEILKMEIESGEMGKINFDPDQGPDMIRVMTIHSAKGLEFKYVFLTNLVDRRMPSSEKKEAIEIPEKLVKDIISKNNSHLEEERRLCYVAMTRAKEKLFFTSAENYSEETTRKKKLSRFLIEMGFGQDYQDSHQKPVKRGKGGKKKEFTSHSSLKKIIEPIIKRGQEEKTISQLTLPSHLSFSQLAAFKTCPLQYKFAHILKIPIRGQATLSFGKTIHNTLFDFFKLINKEKREGVKITDLINLYKKNWIDDWYESKNQKQDYYKLGLKIIKDFYKKFDLEKPKILKINENPAIETAFKLKIGSYTLKGRIDRIDEIKDGIEIIDYKTSKYKEKLLLEDKQQLLIYQIAAEEVLGLKPTKLTYYFLEKGEKTSFIGSEQDKEKLKQNIIDLAEKIKTSDFKATPGWHCDHCDFKDICDYKS